MLFIDFSFMIENMNIDARIDYFNELRNVRPSNFSPHKHSAYEVYFIESGSMILRCKQQLIELKEHDILIIPPNVVHNVVSCDNNFKRFNFSFVFQNSKVFTPDFFYRIYQPNQNIKDEIFQNIAYIHQHIVEKNSRMNYFLVKTYFSIILNYVIEQLLPREESYSEEMKSWTVQYNKLARCLKIDVFFEERFSENITIDDLAAELSYSKAHTNRLLQSYTGLSFSGMLKQARLSAAVQYLSHTNMPISDIAEKCGYSTLRGFELFFYKQMNMLPSEYRNRCKYNKETDSKNI